MNFTVILESRTNTSLYMGSGVLISNRGHLWVITAGHCVGTMEPGRIEKMGGNGMSYHITSCKDCL